MQDCDTTKHIREAADRGEQPICPYCQKPLRVRETQTIDLYWDWCDECKGYVKTQDGGESDEPECANCGAKDWGFTNNGVVEY